MKKNDIGKSQFHLKQEKNEVSGVTCYLVFPYRFLSHFLPDLVLNQIFSIKATTPVPANVIINASISLHFRNSIPNRRQQTGGN